MQQSKNNCGIHLAKPLESEEISVGKKQETENLRVSFVSYVYFDVLAFASSSKPLF